MVDAIGSFMKLPQNPPQSIEATEQRPTKVLDKLETLFNEQDYFAQSDEEAQPEVTKEKVDQAVSKLNKTMETYNTELRFQLHEKSGEYMVKIINSKDHSVVRELPPERVLNMVAYFKEILGLVVDKFA